MKKSFPIIFVLITLSLIGIIYVQINWILAMVENKQELLKHKLADVMADVGQQLVEERESSSSHKALRLKPGFAWRPSDQFMMELMKPPTLAQIFTMEDINDKLKKAFNYRGLKDTRFEFSITSDFGISSSLAFGLSELRSKGYLRAIEDTVHNLYYVCPLQAPENVDLKSILPDEVMVVVVPNYRNVVLSEMRWMIGGAIFFTLVIIAAFYVTVSALLRQKSSVRSRTTSSIT